MATKKGTMVPNYQKMRQITLDRTEKSGFPIGTKIRFHRRTGIVADVNPFFYDMEPLKIVVHLYADEKFKERRHELISIADLTPNVEVSGLRGSLRRSARLPGSAS